MRRISTVLQLALAAACLALPARAETLTLRATLEKAVAQSFDLKIIATEQGIARAAAKSARAEYFPRFQARLNTEYLKDLTDTIAAVTSVGDSVIPAGTRYQNSIGVNLQQTVWDFGVRRRKMAIARHDAEAKGFQGQALLRDLKLKVLDLYTQALLSARTLGARQTILPLHQEIYRMKERLHLAGKTSRLDAADEAVRIAQVLDEIAAEREQLRKHLLELSHYTREPYPPDTTELADLDDALYDFEAVFVPEAAPEYAQYARQIARKQRELEILRRQYLPTASLYSAYNLYGFDPENWRASVRNIQNRTLSLGLSVNVPLFDGLKNLAEMERVKLEIQKLRLELDKKLAELEYRFQEAKQTVETRGAVLTTKAEILDRSEERLSMTHRLSDRQLLEKTALLRQQIEQLTRQSELEQAEIKRRAALQKLLLWGDN